MFSADVLEHVHEDEAERVVAELVRVSRRHLFLSISLKPHTKVAACRPQVRRSVFAMLGRRRICWQVSGQRLTKLQLPSTILTCPAMHGGHDRAIVLRD